MAIILAVGSVSGVNLNPVIRGRAKIVDRSGRVVRVLSGPGGYNFSDVAFSSDGRLVATAEWSGPADRVRVWDWMRGDVLLTIDAEGPLAQVDFDPIGPRVVLSGADGLAEMWDVESGERVALLGRTSRRRQGSRLQPRRIQHRRSERRRLGAAVRRGYGRTTASPARVRMRHGGRGLQSGRHEARLHELVRRRPGPDALNGTSGNDVICGLGGNDIIAGGAGNDTVVGGPGNDKVRGESGTDFVVGGSGSDNVQGGSGVDIVTSVDFEAIDQIDGGPDSDHCYWDTGDTVAGCP